MVTKDHHPHRGGFGSALRRVIAGAVLAPAALAVGIGVIAAPFAHAEQPDPQETDYNRCISYGESKADCCKWSGGVWSATHGCVWLALSNPGDSPKSDDAGHTTPAPGTTAILHPGLNTRAGIQ
jgi:hypothetical protein